MGFKFWKSAKIVRGNKKDFESNALTKALAEKYAKKEIKKEVKEKSNELNGVI